jgi:hypothetical protein
MHRFADRLKLGNKMHPVANTTLRLIGSMKRDWMQTGRRPSGVCGAALFIATHIHGVERSKQVRSSEEACRGWSCTAGLRAEQGCFKVPAGARAGCCLRQAVQCQALAAG